MQLTQHITKNNYKNFIVFYNGKDNDDYQNNDNFCCGNASKGNSKSGGVINNENAELFQYYYHSDHLGSASYITNLDGDIVQHIEYVPFGEVFLEERNNKWNTPYLFNGKELDEETGLYYYGARYYEPRSSLFINVDRYAEKYPFKSPYSYASNNPITFIDIKGDSTYRYNQAKENWNNFDVNNDNIQLDDIKVSSNKKGYYNEKSDKQNYKESLNKNCKYGSSIILGQSVDLTLATPGGGYSVEGGSLFSNNKVQQYISKGVSFGAEASCGYNFIMIIPKNNFKYSDLEGRGASLTINFGGCFSFSLFTNTSPRYPENSIYKSYLGFKLGVGLGFGGSYSPNSKTSFSNWIPNMANSNYHYR